MEDKEKLALQKQIHALQEERDNAVKREALREHQLYKKLHRALRELRPRTPWWVRLRTWLVRPFLRFKAWRYAHLSEEKRELLEDAWLDATQKKLRGNPPVAVRRLETGPEDREVVLVHDFVRYLHEEERVHRCAS
jgi:hypothetical protein